MASLVMAANQRSVPTAVNGAVPNTISRIGVINAPPPTPVMPTTKPVSAPAATRTGPCQGRRTETSSAHSSTDWPLVRRCTSGCSGAS